MHNQNARVQQPIARNSPKPHGTVKRVWMCSWPTIYVDFQPELHAHVAVSGSIEINASES